MILHVDMEHGNKRFPSFYYTDKKCQVHLLIDQQTAIGHIIF